MIVANLQNLLYLLQCCSITMLNPITDSFHRGNPSFQSRFIIIKSSLDNRVLYMSILNNYSNNETPKVHGLAPKAVWELGVRLS